MQNHCQISTPKEYVKSMLDLVGYTKKLHGKTVLENSCGEGDILIEIVRRYITDCRKQGYSDDVIKTGITRDIKAYEIDAQCVLKCIANLTTVAEELGLSDIQWNIEHSDYLESKAADYDFIVGNPPYITYHDLTVETREWLKKSFVSCSRGRFDYYYAFIEKSVASLKAGGSMVYLVPFSVFRNLFAQVVRDCIKPDIVSVVDYRGIRVFDNVTSSAALLYMVKGGESKAINYVQAINDTCNVIAKEKLTGKWFFKENSSGRRFGDYFSVQNSIATLYNNAFLITQYEEDDQYIIIGDKKIEKGITRDAVSTKSCKKEKVTDKIIFPYRNYDGGYEHIPEDVMQRDYPNALEYLRQFKDALSKRKSSKGVRWYEYGRTQALGEVLGYKILISMVITTKVRTYIANENAIPYAGYFIKAKEGSEYDLSFARNLLESPEFYNYVKNTGTPTTETSYRISVKEIENYTFIE